MLKHSIVKMLRKSLDKGKGLGFLIIEKPNQMGAY
jgi:hypothetical protein